MWTGAGTRRKVAWHHAAKLVLASMHICLFSSRGSLNQLPLLTNNFCFLFSLQGPSPVSGLPFESVPILWTSEWLSLSHKLDRYLFPMGAGSTECCCYCTCHIYRVWSRSVDWNTPQKLRAGQVSGGHLTYCHLQANKFVFVYIVVYLTCRTPFW